MNQKGFSNILICVVVLAVILVVGGYFILQPKEAPQQESIITQDKTKQAKSITPNIEDTTKMVEAGTSDWRTYQWDSLGFKLKYPGEQDIHITVEYEEQAAKEGREGPGGFEYCLGTTENCIHIFPAEKETNFSRDAWLNRHISNNPGGLYGGQITTVGGNQVLQFDTKGDVGVRFEYRGGKTGVLISKDMRILVIEGPDKWFVAWYPLATKYDDASFEDYSRMINSFELLN